MKHSVSRKQPSEPGQQIEALELSPQRSRNVDNWPFTFSIIDGEVVKNIYRFNKIAFLKAQEEALF